jgi:hypothetical protein
MATALVAGHPQIVLRMRSNLRPSHHAHLKPSTAHIAHAHKAPAQRWLRSQYI